MHKSFRYLKKWIVISNGADNLILMIANAFVNEGDEVIMADPTFPVYTNVTQIMGGKVIKVKLKDYTHDLDGMLKKVDRKTKLVFVCNPNNPTGTTISQESFNRFLAKLPNASSSSWTRLMEILLKIRFIQMVWTTSRRGNRSLSFEPFRKFMD